MVKKPVINFDPEQLRRELEAAPDVKPRNRYWEPWEDELLREFWRKRDSHLIAEKLGRTFHSIEQRAVILGLTHRGRR